MDQTKSYPDQVRGLAEDIDCAETMSEYDFVSSRLRQLADELEELLKIHQSPVMIKFNDH